MSDSVPTPGETPRPPLDETVVYCTTQGTTLRYRDHRFEVVAATDEPHQTDSLPSGSVGGGDDKLSTESPPTDSEAQTEVGDDNTDEGEATAADIEAGDILMSFPEESVETVNVFGRGVNVTSGARVAASDTDCIINYFTVNGQHRGRFVPSTTSLAHLHEQQHTLDRQERLRIATEILRGKLTNARRFLIRHVSDHEAVGAFDDCLEKLQRVTTLDEARGVEGHAARKYFTALDAVLTDGWSMDGRTRRPPEDHINSLLSLTYTLLQQRCEAATRSINLDPYAGVLHEHRHGRPALALDLLEESRRAIADPLVVRLINQRAITHDDFASDNTLSDGAFDTFLAHFDEYLGKCVHHNLLQREVTRRECIHAQARFLRKTIVGEIEQYEPYALPR